MKYHFDIAAEMEKIAQSAEHQKSMEKLAFSREGKEEFSEVEEEMKKLASDSDCECNKDKDCKGCDCDCHDAKTDKKEASASLEDMAGLLIEISTELEDQGVDRLAAATIVLADNLLKTAAAKKDKKSGKKMTMKERMEKMRAMQKGKKGKGKSESKSKSESDSEKSKSKSKS
eukprot:gnl/Spiro4/1652_TR868_c0_g1_i1.p2 gnl/Spiro4/1652_TR868_c0_g1~~gnl/Spiro4/1652_TR868_c0_g1_i1.p2  ORF type:complete len:173 (+),score=11.32 gnl/Spiro4/1652_TR868_c0_g1_i1:225-743(+)